MTKKRPLYEKLILNLLTNMPLGSMSLTLPDGEHIQIGNGEGVAAKVTIHNQSFFKRCVLYGDIGFGEGYVDGDWDTESITDVIKWFILNVEHAPTVSGSNVKAVALNLMKFYNRLFHSRRDNSLNGSRKNISEHYDLSNDFFALWLDPTMTYSSAYFKEETFTLEEAQKAKYQRLCEQLHLKPSDHVLEIGSGWGGNAIYMASNFGCKVTTITISQEQQKLAIERVKAAGLDDKISVEIQDYRKIKGQYDKIVSVEMLEAVGARYFENYFEQCHKLLKQDGILALQVITCPDSRFEALRDGVDWIQKHIFPGSLLPSVGSMNEAINRTGDLTLVDLKDLGLHYARTLKTWFENFNQQLDDVKKLGFSDSFIRKWNYYLCYCEAAFEMRNINVMQLVYARPNNTGR
ncbi:MAG: cyclopropane-fatty-acyl-phospholipid synthase [Fluviicola sp.]|nr:cyclopropane-fatty-acyl-phospholipid synthase [Fluviicola sp.]